MFNIRSLVFTVKALISGFDRVSRACGVIFGNFRLISVPVSAGSSLTPLSGIVALIMGALTTALSGRWAGCGRLGTAASSGGFLAGVDPFPPTFGGADPATFGAVDPPIFEVVPAVAAGAFGGAAFTVAESFNSFSRFITN